MHPARHGKMHPEKRDIPEKYHSVVDWYVTEYNQKNKSSGGSSNPAVLLGFVGMIPAYDLQKMTEAISCACEGIDSSEW